MMQTKGSTPSQALPVVVLTCLPAPEPPPAAPTALAVPVSELCQGFDFESFRQTFLDIARTGEGRAA